MGIRMKQAPGSPSATNPMCPNPALTLWSVLEFMEPYKM